MARFTMEQLEQLSVGQGGSPATSQHLNGSGTSRDFPVRSDIRQQAYAVLCLANDWMSRAEVAKALHLQKTAWLAAALETLVAAGYAERCTVHGNGSLPTYFYIVRTEVAR